MNKPENTFRCGPITAAVWLDNKLIDQTMVQMHTVKIDKAYKVGDEWKHTAVFSVEDLPKVALVASEIYKYLRLRKIESEAEEGNQSQSNLIE